MFSGGVESGELEEDIRTEGGRKIEREKEGGREEGRRRDGERSGEKEGGEWRKGGEWGLSQFRYEVFYPTGPPNVYCRLGIPLEVIGS